MCRHIFYRLSKTKQNVYKLAYWDAVLSLYKFVFNFNFLPHHCCVGLSCKLRICSGMSRRCWHLCFVLKEVPPNTNILQFFCDKFSVFLVCFFFVVANECYWTVCCLLLAATIATVLLLLQLLLLRLLPPWFSNRNINMPANNILYTKEKKLFSRRNTRHSYSNIL